MHRNKITSVFSASVGCWVLHLWKFCESSLPYGLDVIRSSFPHFVTPSFPTPICNPCRPLSDRMVSMRGCIVNMLCWNMLWSRVCWKLGIHTGCGLEKDLVLKRFVQSKASFHIFISFRTSNLSFQLYLMFQIW